MISVILQQAEIMRMLGWSTTNTFHSDDFTDRITSFKIPATPRSAMCSLIHRNITRIWNSKTTAAYFCTIRHRKLLADPFYTLVHPPFPQMDIIGAMVIVWRVRGKIIRSVLCNIVCNNCTQCNTVQCTHI